MTNIKNIDTQTDKNNITDNQSELSSIKKENEQSIHAKPDAASYCVSSYTRAQAIDDGILVDVSEMAKEAGIKWPVTTTTAVWGKYIEWEESDKKRKRHAYQDTKGRLWDVLSMLRMAINRKSDGAEILYKLLVVPRTGTTVKPQLVTLKAVCHPGDHMEAVITIMLPDED